MEADAEIRHPVMGRQFRIRMTNNVQPSRVLTMHYERHHSFNWTAIVRHEGPMHVFPTGPYMQTMPPQLTSSTYLQMQRHAR